MAGDVLSTAASLGAGVANWLGARSASSKEVKNLRRAQQIQQRNLLMNLDMYDPNRALGYGAMSDLATLYGYTLPAYATSQQLAADTTPLSPKQIKQYIKSGMSLDQIAQMGTLTTPSAKQMKKLRKAGLSADQITQLMNPVQKSDYQGPLQGGTDTGTPAAGNMSRFFTSPDYQFRLQQGQNDIGNSFAAKGGASSGNALKALSQYNQNLASGEYANYVNRLMGLAGIGTQAQGQISQVGTNTANNNSGYQTQIGDAQAAGVLGQYGAVADTLSGIANIWGGSSPTSSGTTGSLSQYGPYASGYQFPNSTFAGNAQPDYGSAYSNYGPYASGYQFYSGG